MGCIIIIIIQALQCYLTVPNLSHFIDVSLLTDHWSRTTFLGQRIHFSHHTTQAASKLMIGRACAYRICILIKYISIIHFVISFHIYIFLFSNIYHDHFLGAADQHLSCGYVFSNRVRWKHNPNITPHFYCVSKLKISSSFLSCVLIPLLLHP